jgi:hypothetical protein
MPAQPGPALSRPDRKLVAGIHAFRLNSNKDVDGRDKPGHDEKD